MKKNRMMRVASALLVAVLLTTCCISGTFAKYTSSSTDSDTARVAKWAFELEGAAMQNTFTFDLFTYTDPNVDVDGNGSEKVIAPGTTGVFEINLTNNSEVNAQYTITFTETNTSNIPLQYSLDGTNWVDSIAELSAITDVAINMGGSATKTIHWRWAFNDTTTAVTDGSAHAGQTNSTDTDLGTAATLAQVIIGATILVEQVD